MSHDRVSVLAPVIAVVATVGLAYAMGLGPFHHDPFADAGGPSDAETTSFITLLCEHDHPEDCQPTDENIRRAKAEARRQHDLEDASDDATPPPVVQPDERKPLPPAVDGVHTLYDDTWGIEEGQWSIGGTVYDEGPAVRDPSFATMLESVGPRSAYLTTPGFYGDFHAVVQLDDDPPPVPSWCQDAAEVSMDIDGDQPAFEMASFESFSDPVAVPAGTYRVRYCTEQQDRAAAQGEDADLFVGRHLLQLWQAPREPDRVLRAGSHWARTLGRS